MRRFSLAAAAMIIALQGTPAFPQDQDPAINPDGSIPPLVAVQSQDYTLARAGFATRLTRQGPAPQRIPMPPTPEGVQLLAFPSDGLTLKAWLGLPTAINADPRAPRPPVVIFLHGGFGFGQEDFDMAAPYRAAGFAVVAPILRGENGQAGSFSLFYDEPRDVIALAAFLRGRPEIDGARIYLAGHSVGGTLALLAAMADGGFRAVASFSGSPDQVIFTRYGIRPSDIPFDPKDDREVQMRSPMAYAASLKAPARLFYGSKEAHFKLSTERLAAIAKAAGLDVEARAIDGDHMSAVPAEVAASIAFFRAH